MLNLEADPRSRASARIRPGSLKNKRDLETLSVEASLTSAVDRFLHVRILLFSLPVVARR